MKAYKQADQTPPPLPWLRTTALHSYLQVLAECMFIWPVTFLTSAFRSSLWQILQHIAQIPLLWWNGLHIY